MERRNDIDRSRTPQGKAQRQDKFLGLLRKGYSPSEAAKELGFGDLTVTKWRSRDADPKARAEFRARMDAALEAGKRTNAGEFPDFLTWREEHCAYFDHRTGSVKRARNSWYQQDATNHLEAHNRLLMVLPPGHIKTTLFAIERSTYDIMRDRNIRITVVQKNENEAKKLIAAVQQRLSDHDYYHFLAERLTEQGDEPITCPLCAYEGNVPFKPAGRDAGGKWGADGFIVEGRSSGEKDLTMQAKGFGSQIQGVRADRIVLDDIQDPVLATKSSADSLEKLDWFRKVILGRVYDTQQVVVLANFFSPDDFAHLLIDAYGEDWPIVNYPAVLDEEAGDILCPDVWTFDALMQKKKEVGAQVWHYTWQQDSDSFDSMTFKREKLEEARDPEFRLREVPFNVTHVFLGVDPATASSGHCSIIAWGIDARSGQRYLIDVFNKTGMRNWDNVTAQVIEMARAYMPRKAIIEGNNTQKGFINSVELQRGLRSLGVRMEIYQTVTGTGARSEQTNFDITTIGGLFDAGLITLPYGGPDDERQAVDEYIHQLCTWRTDDEGRSIKHLKRDMVMATLFAESEAFLVAQRGAREIPQLVSNAPEWAQDRFNQNKPTKRIRFATSP